MKKLLSILLVMCLFVSVFIPISASAATVTVSNVEIIGTLRPGYTLRAGYTLSDPTATAKITWYRGATADNLTAASDKDIITIYGKHGNFTNKFIKLGVTPIDANGTPGAEVFTEVYQIAEPLPGAKGTDAANSGGQWTQKYPLTYKFKTAEGNHYYSLLSEENDEYLIFAQSIAVAKAWDTNNYGWFWPADSGNIGYYLNDESGDLWTNRLDNVKNYIKTHDWLTEFSNTNHNSNTGWDYVVNCKVVIPAIHEIQTYWQRFGYDDFGTYWITRTSAGDQSSMICVNGATAGAINFQEAKTANWYAKPMFYLNKDFFREVKLDLANTGDYVKQVIKAQYTADELKGIYTNEELISLGFEVEEETTDIVVTSAEITGTLRPGYKLTVNYELSEEGSAEFKWYRGATADSLEVVSGVTGQSCTLNNNWGSKYIQVGVTAVDANGVRAQEEFLTDVVQVSAALPNLKGSDVANSGGQWTATYPTQYLFKTATGGKSYALLNEDNNEYLVIAKEGYVQHAWDTNTTSHAGDAINGYAWFWPSDSKNIGYYLNDETGEFWTTKLDAQVKNYIKTHDWLTEASPTPNNYNTGYDYVVNCKVVIPAVHEFQSYWQRFGYADGATWWMTRSAAAADKMIAVNGGESGAYSFLAPNTATWWVRPMFYLNDDFFKTEKLDLAATGDYVKQVLRQRYGRDTLSKIYNEEEMALLGFKTENFGVNNLVVAGVPAIGQQLNAVYKYYNDNTLVTEETGTEYQWYTSATVTGEKTAIAGATGKLYTVTASDAGKYIWVGVTPKDSEGAGGYTQYAMTKKAVLSEEEDVTIALKSMDWTAGDTTVSATLSVKCKEGTKSAIALICSYDGEVLLNCVPVPVSLTTTATDVPLNDTVSSETDSVKIMVWEDMESIRPYFVY